MPNITSVTLTAGVPTAGTGTVGTLDNVTGTAGVPSVPVLTVQGVASGTPQPVSGTVTANATLAAETTKNIGSIRVTDGTNTATVKAVSTAPVTATDQALVVAMRPDSPGIIATGTAGSASSTVLTVQGIAGATPQPVGGVTTVPSTTLTRPATTPTYASGQLFANSATAGSVTNLSWATAARVTGGSGVIIGAQIQKSGNTTTGAAFRVHLFTVAPTYVTAGDTSPLTTVVVASAKGYLGYIDITTMVGFSDVAWGSGAPDNSRGGLPFVASAQTIYGIVEARGAYVGVSGETLTVFLDILQD